MPDEKLLTKQELAGRLGVQPSTIARWAREHKIPERRLSRKVRRYDYNRVLMALDEGEG